MLSENHPRGAFSPRRNGNHYPSFRAKARTLRRPFPNFSASAARVVAEGISVRGLEEIVALGGSEGRPERRTTGARAVAPGLGELSSRLGDRLDTRVKIALGKSKGRVTIEFASLADLKRIVDVIDPS